MDIKNILSARFEPLQLNGFQKGVLNQKKDRLFAYTILSTKDNCFNDLYEFYLKNSSYAIYRKPLALNTPVQDNGWSAYAPIDTEKLIKDGELTYVSYFFYGCFYENDWYISTEVIYHEADTITAVEERLQETGKFDDTYWDTSSFQALPAFIERIDDEAVRDLVAKQNPGISIPLLSITGPTRAYLDNTPWNEVPKKLVPQSAAMRAFIGQPLMVAYIKQEAKEKLNRSYEQYINEAIFIPLISELKIQLPALFKRVQTLYSPVYYPLIYPQNKDYVIAIIKTIQESDPDESDSRLYYFLYHPSKKKIYEWSYPEIRPVPWHHSFYIQEDLSGLSDWGNSYDIFDPSVTMDDPNFWNEYVFKKENGAYLFLKEVNIKNNRKDIYPGF
jgi:hypothetical protein